MRWLIAFDYFIIAYWIYSGVHYLVLIVASFVSNIRHQRRLRTVSIERIYSSPLSPPITLLVPAHNEERTIAQSVRSLLTLTYPDLQVIVINDGSTDQTLEVLCESFNLIQTHHATPQPLKTRPVRGAYTAVDEPRLLALDKEAGGGKSDPLNAGLNATRTPYFCVIDADVILEADALLRVVLPIVLDPDRVVAVGGIVRVANGCGITNGRVTSIALPARTIEAIQVVEYLRGFLLGREGWSALDGLLIISGAFGCFSRQVITEMGGYRTAAIGEDMDLVVRLHRRLRREAPRPYRLLFIPDPVCWTEVPSDWRSLANQRKRWQKGLAQVIWANRSMVLNPRYGFLGMVALPYQIIVELFGPVVEMMGWLAMLASALLGILTMPVFIYFFVFAYLVGTTISMASVVMEELTYRRYQKISELMRLWWLCALEFFPYRQFLVFWRVVAMVELAFGRTGWGTLRRKGFQATHSSPSPL